MIFTLIFGDNRVRVLARSKILWYAENFPVGAKFHFFQIKLYSTEFIDNLLKLKMEMENLIHHAKFEMWPALCKC